MDNNEATGSYPRLPDRFGSKVASYPECSYGAVRVTLVLRDGRRIHDVIIGGEAICKIGQRHIRSESELDFSVADIQDVKSGEYWVPLKGCMPINRKQANMVGFSLICGFLVTAIAVPTLGKGLLSGSLVLGVTIAGYFLGKKLFGS
jgi:hypothetical protein